MFAARFFAARFFTPRYFPEAGGAAPPTTFKVFWVANTSRVLSGGVV